VAALVAQGNAPDGAPGADVPDWPKLRVLAFSTRAGETTLLEETDDGAYFVIHVEAVTPPQLQTLDEVRPQVVAGWQAERRHELAQQRATDLLGRLKDGAPLDQLATEESLSATPIEPLKRSAPGNAQGINRDAVRALFATPPGQFADEVVELPDGFAIVATDEIIAADPSAAADAVEALRTELQNDIRGDLLAQFEAQLRRDYPVEIDGAAINRVISSDGELAGAVPRALPGPSAPF
jgi:peptidyl-prolyl cis-trans isomerase D